VTRNNLYIIPGIDEFFSHLGSPLRSKKKDFIAYRLKHLTSGSYKNPAGSLRNLYYTISLLENDAFVYTVNNNAPQTSEAAFEKKNHEQTHESIVRKCR
jgi:hypothetical protein